MAFETKLSSGSVDKQNEFSALFYINIDQGKKTNEIRILFKNTFFSKDALHRNKNVFKKNSMPEFKVMIKTIMKIFFVGIEENPVNRQFRNFIQF